MIVEALKFAAARLAGQRNTHGHLAELVALEARHARCREAWAGHLAQARSLVLDAARACPAHRRRTALVAGSGLLLEIPLAELSALFGRVVLADLAFPPAVSRLARSLGNVELLHCDLSGCLDDPPLAPEQVPAVRLGLNPRGNWPELGPDLDFACSANLLSQLPLFVLRRLRAQGHGQGSAGAALEDIAAAVVRAHLDWLQALPCPACLLTDTLEFALPMEDSHLDTGHEADLLYGVDHGLAGRTWTWRMAPNGEALPGMDISREVLGVPDVHGCARPARRGARP